MSEGIFSRKISSKDEIRLVFLADSILSIWKSLIGGKCFSQTLLKGLHCVSVSIFAVQYRSFANSLTTRQIGRRQPTFYIVIRISQSLLGLKLAEEYFCGCTQLVQANDFSWQIKRRQS